MRSTYTSRFVLPISEKILVSYSGLLLFVFVCLTPYPVPTASYAYSTVDGFLQDLKLMASNAEAFNGKDAIITKHAHKLYTEAERLLLVERTILGVEKDTYRIQENDIRAKCVYCVVRT